MVLGMGSAVHLFEFFGLHGLNCRISHPDNPPKFNKKCKGNLSGFKYCIKNSNRDYSAQHVCY